MADNTTLNSGTGGDVMRTEDLLDGTKIQNIKINIGDHGVDSGPVSLANPMPVYNVERKTYVCNTGPITGGTAVGTTSLSYLWHPSTETKQYQVIRVNINVIAGVAGSNRIELRHLTAENGTPGGTAGVILPKNVNSPASTGTVRIAATGAPTRSTGVYLGGDVPVNINGNVSIPFNMAPAAIEADEYTVPGSASGGWEIVQQIVTTITTAPVFNISWEWIEY